MQESASYMPATLVFSTTALNCENSLAAELTVVLNSSCL